MPRPRWAPNSVSCVGSLRRFSGAERVWARLRQEVGPVFEDERVFVERFLEPCPAFVRLDDGGNGNKPGLWHSGVAIWASTVAQLRAQVFERIQAERRRRGRHDSGAWRNHGNR